MFNFYKYGAGEKLISDILYGEYCLFDRVLYYMIGNIVCLTVCDVVFCSVGLFNGENFILVKEGNVFFKGLLMLQNVLFVFILNCKIYVSQLFGDMNCVLFKLLINFVLFGLVY